MNSEPAVPALALVALMLGITAASATTTANFPGRDQVRSAGPKNEGALIDGGPIG